MRQCDGQDTRRTTIRPRLRVALGGAAVARAGDPPSAFVEAATRGSTIESVLEIARDEDAPLTTPQPDVSRKIP